MFTVWAGLRYVWGWLSGFSERTLGIFYIDVQGSFEFTEFLGDLEAEVLFRGTFAF